MTAFKSVSIHLVNSIMGTLLVLFMLLGSQAGIAQQVLSTPSNGSGVSSIGGVGGMTSQSVRSAASDSLSKLSAIPEGFEKLNLAPGFLVNLQVFDSDDFSGVYRLDGTGSISLPFAGAIKLADKTVADAQDAVAEKLVAAELFTKPQVRITILEYTAPTVTILGEVAAPGKYPLLAERKFIEVLALAGGVTPVAGNHVEIDRNEGTEHRTINMAYARGTSPASVEDILIKPGDVIHVERAGMIYVLGAVNRPGAYLMQEDGKLDVTQAIALAFGTALQASTGSIRVIRREVDGKLTEIPVLYGRTMKAKESPIILHAEDIIYVPPSKVKTALMDSQSVMSSAASATIYRF